MPANFCLGWAIAEGGRVRTWSALKASADVLKDSKSVISQGVAGLYR
jgi:hypothetical protein